MKKRRPGLILFDLLILTAAYMIMAGLKPSMLSYLSPKYLIGFGVMVFLWMFASFYFNKYSIDRREKPKFLIRNIIIPNLVSLAFIAFIIYAFNTTFFSRMMVFGTVGLATVLELMFFSLYTYLIASPEYDRASEFLERPPTTSDIKKMMDTVVHSERHSDPGIIYKAVADECGESAAAFVDSHVDMGSGSTLVTSTVTRFNILRQPDGKYDAIVNIRRVNDIRHLNQYFESVNHKLPDGGIFVGCAETAKMRQQRLLRKYPPVINRIMVFFDYILKRVFPKFQPTRGIYFFLTRGNNRVLTRAEILGRLYASGFEIIEDRFIGQHYFFVMRRMKEPAFDTNPTYGPFITLRRVGKDGKLIKVYKLRTMYPYAEYLQDYVHSQNSLENGGKFKNDFRVARSRQFLRKLWLDELPMLLNVLKGEIKIVGVRPLSQHYFNLYSRELQELRIQFRPGLIPPYYADMPETLEEIQESEKRYLEAFRRHPLRTQFSYFWKAIFNIIFRRARSS